MKPHDHTMSLADMKPHVTACCQRHALRISLIVRCLARVSGLGQYGRSFKDMPSCRLDKFSRRFRETYPQVDDMLSATARASLLLLAFLMQCDTALIECGHALVNKLRRKSGNT
jgi:hypothetical protein